jgi:transposase InsO family protein
VAQAAERCRGLASYRQVARRLGIPERTLRAWRHICRNAPKLRGRAPSGSPLNRRQQVIQFLHRVSGPAIGLPALRALFPDQQRCILADLLRRYRRVWRRRHQRKGYRLQWHRPGTIWAMDHSEATQLIDGQYEQIFAVRDLASHRQLAWRGVQSTGAAETCDILEELFVRHGPPLVIKSDQGPAFIAELTQQLLRRCRVTPLFSPKGQPQYNGALERANGTHKVYTHQHAVADGHSRYWTTSDLDAARDLANTVTRPWGHQGPCPDEVWQQREPITDQQRDEFARELESQRDVACTELGFADRENLTPIQQDRLERLAISQTLDRLGYVTKQEVRRPPRKTKRRTPQQMQKRLKREREKAADADTSTDASNLDVDHQLEEMLAFMARNDRMQPASCDARPSGRRVSETQDPRADSP